MPDDHAARAMPQEAASLAERTYAALRADLVAGRLAEDAPLRLDALRERYGVSLSPLREALSRLQSERLVLGTAQRGWRVPPLSADAMWDAIRVRILIEGEALRDSIAHGDDSWEVGMVAALHALRLAARAPGDADDVERRHRAFHRSLLAASRSPWLLDLSDLLSAQTERYRRPVLARAVRRTAQGDGRDLDAEHGGLLEAAVARDADLAVARLAEHYRRTGEEVAAAVPRAGRGTAGR